MNHNEHIHFPKKMDPNVFGDHLTHPPAPLSDQSIHTRPQKLPKFNG